MKSLFLLLLSLASATTLLAAAQLRINVEASGSVSIRWSGAPGTLEEKSDLSAAVPWRPTSGSVVSVGDDFSVSLPSSDRTRYFRLLETGGHPLPSSRERIEEAVSRGDISAETGTLYRIFANFRDPRLPGAYQGSDVDEAEFDALSDALDNWASLSNATREAILPFLMPPAYIGSWATPAPALRALNASAPSRPEIDANWAHWPAVSGGHVKVWYDTRVSGAGEKAAACGAALSNEIWPALIGLGMREPLSDLDASEFDGGDARLDVYLSNMAAAGMVSTHFGAAAAAQGTIPGTKMRPVYMVLNQDKTMHELRATLAHEFMHACQWAYPVSALGLNAYQWLKESTALWAIDYVYPTNNFEHNKARDFCIAPRITLDSFTGEGDNRAYGSYLFFQFLARSERPQLISDIWAATTANTDQLAAVNKSIPGGFKEQWPKFARAFWNQDPVSSKPASFKQWDSMPHTPVESSLSGIADLGGQKEAVITLLSDQPNLSTEFYNFDFFQPDTRSMLFHNTFYSNRKAGQDINVYAFWKNAAGAWTEEDWTTNEWIGFCRDQKDQRVVQLVVIVSSAKWENPDDPITAATPPTFKRNNLGCWGYQGSASRVTTDPHGGVGQSAATATNVRFGFRNAHQETNPGTGRLRVPVGTPLFTDAALAFDERYTQGDCTYTANGSWALRPMDGGGGGNAGGGLVINYFPEALPEELRDEQATLIGPNSRSYTGNGVALIFINGRVTGCEGETTYLTTPEIWWLTNDAAWEDGGRIPSAADDGHLRGVFNDPAIGVRYTWDLAPVAEP